MNKSENYLQYTRAAREKFAKTDAAGRYDLVAALENKHVQRVLDVGCGAGQSLVQFAEKTSAKCFGVDIAEKVGEVGKQTFADVNLPDKAIFLQSRGEYLPFSDESFDVVICLVALPYMDNRRTLAEIARVLKTDGVFFLKIHAPQFYLGMMRRRLKTFSVKQMAYPAICLAGGMINLWSGKHPTGNFWDGKEVFQTENFLQSELKKNGLKIQGSLPDTNPQTPSFVIVKN